MSKNIYYLGHAGVINVGGLRIGGLSGIFSRRDYNRVSEVTSIFAFSIDLCASCQFASLNIVERTVTFFTRIVFFFW